MPIINKEEEELKFNYQNDVDFYKNNSEQNIWKLTKAKRKEQWWWVKKFKENKFNVWDLVINKPKDTSPAGEVLSIYWAWATIETNPEKNIPKENLLDKYINLKKNLFGSSKTIAKSVYESDEKTKATFDEVIVPVTKEASKTAIRVFDTSEKIFKKPISSVSSVFSMAKHQLEEVGKASLYAWANAWGADIEHTYSPLKASEAWEKDNRDIEYLWWVKNDFKDYISFRTSNEVRDEILKDIKPEEREAYKDRMLWPSIVADVTAWILSWVTYWRLWKIGQTKTTWATQKIIKALDETINPSLNNMAKFWAWLWAVAIANYWATGKWMFEDDKVAEEWAYMAFGALWIKGIWEIGKKTYKEITTNPQFIEWVKNVVDRYAKYSWAKLDVLWNQVDNTIKVNPKEISPEKRTSIFNKAQELRGVQLAAEELWDDVKYNSADIKAEKIKELTEEWVLEFKGLDWKNLSWEYNDAWMEIILGKKWDKSRPNIGVHLPPALYKKHTGIDLLTKAKTETDGKALIKQLLSNETERSSKKVKDNFIVSRLKKDWYWLEWKSNFKNYTNWISSLISGKIYNNVWVRVGKASGDTWIKINNPLNWMKDWIFNPANRPVKEAFESQDLYGKNENIKQIFNDVSDVVWEDIWEFDIYLFAKSRLNKALSFKWELNTVIIKDDWTREKLTTEQLLAIVKEGEEKYWKLAERIWKENNKVLDAQVESWIITKETADKYKETNPNYVPDKNTAYEDQKIAREWFTSNTTKTWQKELTWGSETDEFSTNSLQNLFTNISIRNRSVAINNKFKTIVNFWDESLAIPVEAWKKIKDIEGYEEVWVFINWEKKLFQMPKNIVADVRQNDDITTGIIGRALQTPTSILKFQATGWLNFLFQSKQLVAEGLAGIMYNYVRGWRTVDFISSVIRSSNSLMSTPAQKAALYELLRETGWDFTRNKLLQKELLANVWESWRSILKNKNTVKAIKWSSNFWHRAEKLVTRMPIFESQLKAQGLNSKRFWELLKASKWNQDTLKRMLVKEWIDFNKAWEYSRNFFDFNAASNSIDKLSKYLPYFNIGVSGLKNIDTMIEANPNKFLKATSVLWAMWVMAYKFNSWTIPWNEDERRQEFFSKQPAYIKYSPSLLWFDEENWKVEKFDVIWNNIPLLDLIYTMIVEGNEKWTPWIKSANVLFKNATYAWSLEEFGWVDWNKLPPIVKNPLEAAVNKDFFQKRELVPFYNSSPWLESEEYDKYTNPLYIKASRVLASFGGTERPDWIIEWGIQISPKKLEKIFQTIDSTGFFSDKLAITINEIENIWVTDTNVKQFKSIFKKVYNLQTNEPLTNEETSEASLKKINKRNVKDLLSTAKTKEEAIALGRQQAEKYKELTNWEDTYKPLINNQIKERIKEIKLWKTLYREVNSWPDVISTKLQRLYLEQPNIEESKKVVNNKLKQLKSKGWMTDRQIDNIKKAFNKKLNTYYKNQ